MTERFFYRLFWQSLVCVLLVPGGVGWAGQEPAGLLLTWQDDPTTTMTIDWHTEPGQQAASPSRVQYKRVGDQNWDEAEAQTHDYPHSDRTIHRVELAGLEPDTSYRFRVGSFERAYKFRTMPLENVDRPVVFAAGGDVRHRKEWMVKTNRVAMRYDPDFVVWGGDLAYADAREDRVDRWYDFFDALMQTLISEEGRVVPVLAAIGNHEVKDHWYRNYDGEYEPTDEVRAAYGPYFYSLFAFPGQPGYGVLDFGDYLSVLLLDSDHSNPIDGQQLQWLEAALADRQGRPHVFPVYHVAGFPSYYDYDGPAQSRVREHWTPLFERYGVRAALENHDHAYKRTPPIRDLQVSADGVVYIGDGAWGVGTRWGEAAQSLGGPDPVWYLSRAEPARHAIIVTLQGGHQHFLMVNEFGDMIDEYPRTPHTRPQAVAEHDEADTLHADAATYINGADRQMAYAGRDDLQLKSNRHNTYGHSRKAYLRFDVSDVRTPFDEASLVLVNAGYGSESLPGKTWTFQVYGLLSDENDWAPHELTWDNAPGHDPESGNGVLADQTELLGEFEIVEAGVVGEQYTVEGERLARFLNEAAEADGLATLIVVRQTLEEYDRDLGADGIFHVLGSSNHFMHQRRPRLELGQ